MPRLNLAEVANRVAQVEQDVKLMKDLAQKAASDLNNRLTEIETTSQQILAVVETAKTTSRFVRRWAGPVIASAATAGFFNPKFTTFLNALFN